MDILKQCQKWHEESKQHKIIDALEAIPAEERTPEMDSELARAYNNLADPHKPTCKEMLKKALALLKPHEEYFEDDYYWNFRMGYSYFYLDQEGRALRYFEKALEVRPGDDDTKEFIDRCKQGISLPQFWECFRDRTENWWETFAEMEAELRQMMDDDKDHTRVSAEAGATTVSYKWHALFLITELAAYIPYFMLGDTHYNILMISLFLCSVLISTLSLVFHAFINKSERHVYSMDSKLNLIVNNTMKKYKSIAMLLLSGLNAVAWIYVALYTSITGILPASSYYVYIFIQLIAVLGFIVPIYMGLNRKKELLSANTSPIDVDDDEYWKTGYYYNPDDKHILIENRMQSGNYTFNYAKKGAWIFTGITCAITAGCIILVFVCMLPLINIQEKITLTNNNLTISAGGYTSEIDVNDITELKLLDELPYDSFLRTNGASTDSYDIGRYEGRTLGKCSLYVFDGYSPILMIKSDDTLVFVNSKEDGEIEGLYEELSQ